jgi:hypothetical protein
VAAVVKEKLPAAQQGQAAAVLVVRQTLTELREAQTPVAVVVVLVTITATAAPAAAVLSLSVFAQRN